jgi:hypothetical protein
MKQLYTTIAALMLTNLMFATTITAITNNGKWATPATWDANRVPQNNDSIVIPANITVKMDKPRSLDNVIVQVFGTLYFESGKLNLNNTCRVILENGGRVSGTDLSEHLTIGTVIKFYGNEAAVTGAAFADSTTGVSPNGFTLGVLPVTFTAFYTALSGSNVLLHWSTEQEINNHRFEIERSINGQKWNRIAEVRGAGTSNIQNKYTYVDNSFVGEVVYYRIRQVDVTGHSKYSAVRIVRINGTMAVTTIYTSAKQTVTIDMNSEEKNNLRVRVLNLNGSVVAQQVYQQAAYRLTMKVPGACTGIYVIQVSDNNGWSEVKKVLL